MASGTSRVAPWRWLVAVLAASMLVLVACGDDDESGDAGTDTTEASDDEAAADDRIVVQAGVNDEEDPTIAVLEYLPESVTVAAGTTVRWEIPGPEPHTVTFVPDGEEPPPPGSEERLAFNAPAPPEGPYDGSTAISSGLGPAGPEPFGPFDVVFDTPGEYQYFCAIHPQMTGAVTVVEEGGDADTQADVTERGEAQRDEYLEEGRAAKQELMEAETRSEENADGTTTWFVEMGATTPHTDILAFAPVPVEVAPGDTVTFVNNSGAPHTATFGPQSAMPANPESEEAMAPAPGPSPQTVREGEYVNTGWLPPDAPPGSGPPEAARSYSVTVPEAGQYAYVCLLHIPSGMGGVIQVS